MKTKLLLPKSLYADLLYRHVSYSIDAANRYSSKINDSILSIDGGSSKKGRHFFNNLLSVSGLRYLEIGSWKGSTLISALFDNEPEEYWAVDNWSQFGGPKEQFYYNFVKTLNRVPHIIERDCFSFDPLSQGIHDVDVYFFDGEHSEDSHALSLKHYIAAMSRIFVFVVDDWSWSQVKSGTHNAIKDLDLKIHYRFDIESDSPSITDDENWHNGMGVFILGKP